MHVHRWRDDEPVDVPGRSFPDEGPARGPKPFGGSEPVIVNAGSAGASTRRGTATSCSRS